MASVNLKESSKDGMDNQTDEEDIRGDGKKKKFKPLSAVRKFFGKKRKKEDVVTMKAQSTTTLHSGYDDDDDDGGFKAHQKKTVPLVGTRSISEDSIFSPEPRDHPPSFPTVTVSEESIPKSAFQSELFTKLNKRRSVYSDDEQDEGLPRSPVPLVTTADVIGESLKPLMYGKKPSGSNRDSEQSLISVDGSDLEDDLFTTKWKSSVPARKSANKPKPTMSESSDLDMDFSSIEKTEVLTSTAAKDRISIKPSSRRASRLSRKKKDSSLSKSLPCLNEELSPSRPKPDAMTMSTNSKDIFTSELSSSQPERKKSLPNFSHSSDKTFHTVNSQTTVSKSSTPSSKPADAAKTIVSTANSQSVANISMEKTSDRPISPKDKEKKVAFSDSKIKDGGGQSPSLKVSDPDSSVTLSPREGYKLKRQNRSKTLPAGSGEEESSPKIQRASSQRTPVGSSMSEDKTSEDPPKATTTPTSSSVKKLGASRFNNFTPSSNTTSEPSWVSKAKQKKLEQVNSEDKEQPKLSEEESVKKEINETTTANKSPEPASPVSKIAATSSFSSQDKRVSTKSKEFSEKDKKVEVSSSNFNTKRSSIDISSTRRESIDIDVKELSSIKDRSASFNTAGKSESATTKVGVNSQDDAKSKLPSSPPSSSTPLSMAERARLFSSAAVSNCSSTSTSTNSSKPPSGGSIHPRAASVKMSPTKSVETKSSFSTRPGSVKGASFSSPGSSSTPNIKSDSSTPATKETSSSDSPVVTKASNPSTSSNPNFSSSSPSNSSTISSSSSTASSQSSLKTLTHAFSNSSSSSFSKTNLPGGKTSSSFVAKAPISSSASASSSSLNSNQKPPPSLSPSSSSSSSSSTSKSSSKTQISPIRSHQSFTATSPFRPQVSTTPQTSSNRSPALTKSTSMKVSTPATQKLEEKKTETTPSNVPAWRANLQKKDNVKIEIIEKKSSSSSSSSSSSTISSTISSSPPSSQSKNENVRKFGDNSRISEMAKKTDSTPTLQKTPSTSNRSSKVLDMVKNFQNLQVST